MRNIKILIRIAAILLMIRASLYVLFGLLLLEDLEFFTIIIFILAALHFAVPVTLLIVMRDEDFLVRKRSLVLVFAILSIFANIIAAILLFISYDKLGAEARNMNALSNAPNPVKNNINNVKPAPKEKISPEKRKIDILAKFGVFLVALSGIILSTSYNGLFNDDIVKPIIMCFLVVVFRALYYVFEKKVVIKSSSKLYYILSYLFITLVFVSIGYFGVFGYNLSFDGELCRLMLAIVFISLAFGIIKIHNKYGYKVLPEISFSLVIISLLLVLSQLEFEYMQILSILLVITLFIYMNKDKLSKSIVNVSDVMFVICSLLYLLNYASGNELSIFNLVIGIFIAALLRQRIVTKDRCLFGFKVAFPIFINLLIVLTINLARLSCVEGSISEIFITPNVFYFKMIEVIFMLITGYLFMRGKDKETVYCGLISSTVLSILITLSLFTLEYSMIALLSSLLIFIFITIVLKKSEKKALRIICFVEQLIATLMLAVSGVMFYINNGIDLTYDTIAFVFILFVLALSKLEKNVFNEFHIYDVAYYFVLIGLILCNAIFMTSHTIIFNIIILLALFLYRRFTRFEEKQKQVFDYLFAISVFLNLSNILVIYTTTLVSNIILLLALLAVAYYFSSEKYTSYLLLVLSYVPFIYVMNELNISNELFIILTRIPLLILVFVITRKILVTKINTSNILELIFLPIVFFTYIFQVELTLGLFTFVLALAMLYVGFRYEKYFSLFYVGIGVTLLNIIVQLSDFWSSIPLPVYLLLSGLVIIGYVTYKELSKGKKKEPKQKNSEDKTEVDKKAVALNSVLLVITLISVLFNAYNINKQEEIKLQKEREIELLNKGFDPNKIYLDNSRNTILIVKGNHYDVKALIDLYRNQIDDDPDYRYDRYYGNYYSYAVVYLDKEDFIKAKKSKDYYKYEDYGENYFYYNGNVNRNYYVNGVEVSVENEIINYVEEDYTYGNNSKRTLKLKYNTYDVDSLKLNFSNTKNRKVTVTTGNNETYIINGDGTHEIASTEGRITIVVYDVELNIDDEIKEYYNQY